ncbi:MAG: hypothetical protein ACI4RR_01510 [Eubacterium sp.]
MKEKYIKPQTVVERFKTISVITTSSGDDIDPGDNDIEWGT